MGSSIFGTDGRPSRPTEVYAIFAALMLAWGYWTNPSDLGGTGLRGFLLVLGTVLTEGVVRRCGKKAGWVIIPLIAFLPLTLYFAPLTLMPFLALIGLMFGVVFAVSAYGSVGLSLLLALIVLAPYVVGAVGDLATVVTLRHLVAEDIASIQITANGQEVQIASPADVQKVALALRDTVPYSPDHERMGKPVVISIVRHDARPIQFAMAHGNRSNPDAAWIQIRVQLGSATYQNARLFNLITREVKITPSGR